LGLCAWIVPLGAAASDGTAVATRERMRYDHEPRAVRGSEGDETSQRKCPAWV